MSYLPTVLLALLVSGQLSSAGQPRTNFAELSKKASAAREANRLEEAITLYRKGVALRPAWAEGWWYLGTLLYELDRYEEAAPALARLVALEPKGGAGWALLGLCQFQTRDYDRALANIQRARSLGLGGNEQLIHVSSFHLALLLTRFELYEASAEILFQLARDRYDSPTIVEALGLSVLRLPFLPRELPPDKRELVLKAGRATAFAAGRRIEDATREYGELVERFPKEPNVHYAAGVYYLQGDPDKALAEFRRELEISPSHVPARLQIAFEYIRRGEHAAGLPLAREAVSLAPKSFAARNALGRILLETGDIAGAIGELEAGTKMAPDSPEMHFALARAYRRAGRDKEAERERSEFARLNQLRRERKEGPQAVGGVRVPVEEEPPR